jgi:aliphatic nitrilase
MSPDSQIARIGAVQAAPAFLDRDASIGKAAALIRDAQTQDVQVLGFPEGFIPGHPGWVELQAFNYRTHALGKTFFEQAVELRSDQLDLIRDTCCDAEMAVVLGLCEKRSRTTGTLYNTQIHISTNGTIVCHHQTFVPTVGERLVHSQGTTGVANTSAWHGYTVSSLICGENSHPLAQYSTALMYPTIHVASWPQHFSPELPIGETVRIASRALAYSLKCFVINAVSPVSPEMKDIYGYSGLDEYLSSDTASGRASIISPSGEILSEATSASEQILIRDIHLDDVIIPKLFHDVAGHYDRPDLFRPLFQTANDQSHCP